MNKYYIGIIGLLVLVIFASGCTSNQDETNQPSPNFVMIERIYNETYPIVIEYNKSKDHDTLAIPIKGLPLFLDTDTNDPNSSPLADVTSAYFNIDTTNFTNINDSYTIFYIINTDKVFLGKYPYQNYGEVKYISVYKPINDIIAIYWPEKKVAGWHRVYGREYVPSSAGPGAKGILTGDNLPEWFNSLPNNKYKTNYTSRGTSQPF